MEFLVASCIIFYFFNYFLQVRKEAPSAELQAKLAQERETRKQNAIKWEEEFQRKELQAQMTNNQQQQEQQQQQSPIASIYLQNNTNSALSNVTSSTTTTNHTVNTSTHRRSADTTLAIDPSAYKAVDTSNMNTEQTRDVMKLYSQVRTSPFLGKKPQVRSNSSKAPQQDEEEVKM